MIQYTAAQKKLLDASYRALDTTEASWDADFYVPVTWFDAVCSADGGVVSDSDVEENIKRSNAILMRSNATFKLQLGQRLKLPLDQCSILRQDSKSIAAVQSQIRNMTTDLHVAVVSINIRSETANFRTDGFSIGASRIAFVDKSRIKVPTDTMMHEIGHAWNLPHPFNADGIPIGDLPRACSVSNSRVSELESCPTSLRTCTGAVQDEDLENVMDYLPETCGRKYHFSPWQISVITANAESTSYIYASEDFQLP